MSAHAIFYKKLRSKNLLFYLLCFVCVVLVSVNIIYSQKYNEHMYGVMGGESRSILSYLKHIWGTPLFEYEIETYKAEGKNDILLKWEEVQQENTKRIQILEEATKLHPYSPELYYNLYLLYSENGDKVKAKENLQKARQIDPSI